MEFGEINCVNFNRWLKENSGAVLKILIQRGAAARADRARAL